jgi:hypothetical protein
MKSGYLRPRRTFKDDIKVDLRQICSKNVNWTHMDWETIW